MIPAFASHAKGPAALHVLSGKYRIDGRVCVMHSRSVLVFAAIARAAAGRKHAAALRLAAALVLAAGLPACQREIATGPSAEPSQSGQTGDTIFSDDFEAETLAAWQDGIDPARHRLVTDPGSAQSGSRYLAVTYPPGEDGGWLTRFFMPGYDAVHVSYHVRFPDDWRGGTKLIALYGSRTDDQWSAFGKAGVCPDGNDFFAAMVVADRGGHPGPARFYTYFPAMSREPNGVTCWGRFGDGSETYVEPLVLDRGEWHRVELSVTLNTPGQSNAHQRFWLDGVERGQWSGFSLRNTDMLRLNSVQLTFSTDADSRPRELHVDNLVVSAGSRSGAD